MPPPRVSASAVAVLWVVALARCAGDRSRPTCGIAQLVGPAMVQQRMTNVVYLLADAPRGLPGSLPARVVGQAQQGEVLVAYDKTQLLMDYQGPAFPASPGGYGVLVVDDSTQRAEGVIRSSPGRRRPLPSSAAFAGPAAAVPSSGFGAGWGGLAT